MQMKISRFLENISTIYEEDLEKPIESYKLKQRGLRQFRLREALYK